MTALNNKLRILSAQKRAALVAVTAVAILGLFFLALNILDIDEDFRFNFPINVLNTVFITVLAAGVAFLAARLYRTTGSSAVLAMGCAQLAIGTGRLIRALFPGDLATLIIINESSLLLGSIIHLFGATSLVIHPKSRILKTSENKRTIVWWYSGILIVIALFVFLTVQNIIPLSDQPNNGVASVQNALQIISMLLLFVSAIIYFVIFRGSHTDLYYWYFLGLLAFSMGVFFISQGPLQSRIAWTGRIAQYSGNICFLVSLYIGTVQIKINNRISNIMNQTIA